MDGHFAHAASEKISRMMLQEKKKSQRVADPAQGDNIFKNLANAINAQADAERKSNVHEYL